MLKSWKLLAAAGMTLAISAAPAVAQSASPEGQWRTIEGESQYEMLFCGGGDELCGRLVWLRPDTRNADTNQYLDKPMLNARRVGEQKWRGQVQAFGHGFNGEIEVVNPTTMTISGCLYFIICKTYTLSKVGEARAAIVTQ